MDSDKEPYHAVDCNFFEVRAPRRDRWGILLYDVLDLLIEARAMRNDVKQPLLIPLGSTG